MKEIIRVYNWNEHKLIGFKVLRKQNSQSAVVKQKNIPARLVNQIKH
jgi:hypothetical protein